MKIISALGGLVIAMLALTGCGSVSPCALLAAPTSQELAVVQSGAEVEREIGGAECDLVDGRWSKEEPETT